MISIQNLSKKYGENIVLNIEELQIPKGQSFGLVGNNGAGKTTMFRCILDLIKPTTGVVKLKDNYVSSSEDWKSYTGSYLDEHFLIDFLTPEEYFYFIGSLHQQSKEDVNQFLKDFETLFNDEIINQGKYIRDLSKGNQKKVGIVAALIGQPEILILDEPFANLDPSTQIRLKSFLKKLDEEQQVTMLISSHDLNHVAEVCERIVVLEKGALVHDIVSNQNTLKELEQYFGREVSEI